MLARRLASLILSIIPLKLRHSVGEAFRGFPPEAKNYHTRTQELNMSEQKPNKDPKTGRLLPGHTQNLEHGGWFWLRHGKLPSIRGKRRIQRELSELKRQLEQAIPDSEDPRRALLISQCIITHGYVLLLSSWHKRAGILDLKALSQGKLEVQGSLTNLNALLNTQQRALSQLLGMGSKTQEALNLGKYIEARDKEKAKEEEKPS